MAFGPRLNKKDKYNNCKLEVADSFKYLGTVFNFNSKFKVAKRKLIARFSKAMFMLPIKISKLNLPIIDK